jgi:hypothetical protein
MASSDPYPASEWFPHLFGFDESVPAVQKNLEVKELDDHAEITSLVNHRTFNAGKFRLRDIPSFGSPVPVGGGTLNIIRGARSRAGLENVLAAQSHPDFDGATFLAASNFNCLEFTGQPHFAEMGVTPYVSDMTQGPYCALGAGAAVVYRNYFVLHEDGTRGQLNNNEVRLLKNTPLDEFVSHGYPKIRAADSEKLKPYNWEEFVPKFLIGVHENCEVTTTETPPNFSDAPPGRIVHQVYAAAFNFNYWNDGVNDNPITRDIAEKLLRAEYRATILAAWELSLKYPGRTGSKKLVLSLLGGGVHGNPMELICGAITSCEALIVDSGLQCYVVCYSGTEFENVFPHLEEVMQRTGGSVLQ